jgi:hypothetical protein
MAKNLLRLNVGGIIFHNSTNLKDEEFKIFDSIESWVEARSPGTSFIYDTPVSLISLGLPIMDARFLNGSWVKKPLVRKGVDVTLTPKHWTKTSAVLTSAEVPDMVSYPSLIFFNENSLKHKPKSIGTNVKVW